MKPHEGKKTAEIRVRLSEDEKKKVLRRIKSMGGGLSINQWARMIFLHGTIKFEDRGLD